MKIIEVRDGFIKFEANQDVYLSSFIQVNGDEKSYIAQVNQIKTIGNVCMASAKFLFININGELYNYDKTLPSTDAEIEPFTDDILNNSINAKEPVIIGRTLDNSLNINIDSSAFNKKMLVSVDSTELNNLLIRNFSRQFDYLGKNVVIIDTLGIINAKKYVAGKDFKLTLNTKALKFMYESCLNDATAESKSTIMEIFKELSEYSETVPFVPFETLKTIINDMVDKQHVFKLLILKNKLAKFEKLGYFASTKEDVENLDKILQSKCAIIDLSQLDTLFQNNYLDYLYEKIQNKDNMQVFLETSNTVSKKVLKKILIESDIPTTIVTHSKFKYLNDVKNLFDNFIIEPSITNNEVFSVYASFLSSMQKNTYLTAGESINYIPMVSEAQPIDDFTPIPKDEIDVLEESSRQKEYIEEENVENPKDVEESEENFDNNDEIINISVDDESVTKEDAENYITNEEVMATIDEKADKAISSVAENLENIEELDLFSEEDNNNQSISKDFGEEDAEDISSQQLPPDTEKSEENEIYNILEESQEDEAIEEYNEASDNDSDFIEASYNEIVEPETNSYTEELGNESLEENSLTEFEGENRSIGDIEDDTLIQDEDNILDELSSSDNEDVFQETGAESDISMDLQESTVTEQIQGFEEETEQAEALIEKEELEEIPIESDDDINLLLEETEELQYEPDYVEPSTQSTDVDLSEPAVIPIPGEELNHDFDEIVELDSSEAADDDIIVDLNEDDNIQLNDEVEQQIMEDVDKVYTTMKNDEPLEEISDSDLDFIDELNNDGDELEEYTGEELEEISDSQDGIINEVHEDVHAEDDSNDSGEILEKRDSNTPIVPVYDADIPQEDMVMSDPIQQGDAVMHVKYGNGVVEKMIKYGNKTLFAINFENIGRRLLDPTLTEIKRV